MNTSARPRFRSARTAEFTESVIRDMTRQAIGAGAVNLAQGFPDFPAPEWLKTAAAEAIAADHNQYPITWGIPPLRQAIADKTRRHYGLEIDPAREITVVCGATEGMAAVLLALVDPGDEVIVFEPYYENYHPDSPAPSLPAIPSRYRSSNNCSRAPIAPASPVASSSGCARPRRTEYVRKFRQ